MSKQLLISAAFSIFAMAAFALSAPAAPGFNATTGAPAIAAAPAFEVSLPGY